MGIDIHTLNFLRFVAQDRPLGRVATIGRQEIHISPRNRRSLLGAGAPEDKYCEEVLKQYCGAALVESYDNSDYEGATHITDMNKPMILNDKYDTVIDGGCLEHIFNAAQALKNFSDMCAPGGRIIHSLPANNECGHGFWQVSPELFFSLYSEENGYQGTQVFLADLGDRKHWYEVMRPAHGKRAIVRSRRPVYALARTTKVQDGRSFATVHQSDYAYEWASKQPPGPQRRALFGLVRMEPVTTLSVHNPSLVRHAVRSLVR